MGPRGSPWLVVGLSGIGLQRGRSHGLEEPQRVAPLAALGGAADGAVDADDIRCQPRRGHGAQEMQGLGQVGIGFNESEMDDLIRCNNVMLQK